MPGAVYAQATRLQMRDKSPVTRCRSLYRLFIPHGLRAKCIICGFELAFWKRNCQRQSLQRWVCQTTFGGGGALVNSVRCDADSTGRVLACLQIGQIGDDAPEGDWIRPCVFLSSQSGYLTFLILSVVKASRISSWNNAGNLIRKVEEFCLNDSQITS